MRDRIRKWLALPTREEINRTLTREVHHELSSIKRGVIANDISEFIKVDAKVQTALDKFIIDQIREESLRVAKEAVHIAMHRDDFVVEAVKLINKFQLKR